MTRPNLYDYIKVLALITMVVDHVGFFIFPDIIWLRVIGRIAFPLFLLLVGYNGSYKSKLHLRVIALLIALGVYGLYGYGILDQVMGIILLVIVATRVLLGRLTKQAFSRQIAVWVISIITTPLIYPWVDYGMMAVSFALVGRRMRHYRAPRVLVMRWSTLLVHMGYMIALRHFPPTTYRALWCVALWLFWIGKYLYTENTSLRLTLWRDASILWLSRHALMLYIIHAIVLIIIALLLWSFSLS